MCDVKLLSDPLYSVSKNATKQKAYACERFHLGPSKAWQLSENCLICIIHLPLRYFSDFLEILGWRGELFLNDCKMFWMMMQKWHTFLKSKKIFKKNNKKSPYHSIFPRFLLVSLGLSFRNFLVLRDLYQEIFACQSLNKMHVKNASKMQCHSLVKTTSFAQR